jgi:CHAT domain-containing protein
VQAAARLILIPCGLLGLLPLHAALVPGSASDRRTVPLQDAVRITYVPSARIWLASRRRVQGHHSSGAPIALVVGNPLPLPEGVSPLAGAEDEARRVTSLVRGEAGAEVYTLVGEAATRRNVMAALRERGSTLTYAHFACHGLANPDHPERSALMLADGARLSVRDLTDPDYGIHFDRMRLATLSACQTAIPGTALSDEVVGLPSGWLQAGTTDVLASLWPVDDAATVALMTRFYELHLLDGVEPADALWLAQRWLRGLPTWREDCTAAGAARTAAGPEAAEVVRELAAERGAGAERVENDEKDEEAEDRPAMRAVDETSAAGGVARSAKWEHPRIWAAFAVYGA